MKRRLFRQLLTPSLVAAFAWISFAVAQGAALKTFYVAPDGNDAWSGGSAEASGSDGPFATLERARDAVREFKKTLNADASGEIVVSVAAGVYELNKQFELTGDDSGTENVTVRWESNVDSPATLVGGKYLAGAKKLDDASILARLKEDVRDKIVAVDLKANGFDDLGTPAAGPELFFQGEPTRIARYPNEGFIKITDLVREGTHETDIRGTKGIQEGKFFFAEDEPTTWDGEPDIWVDGYWFWD
jgi:hypothetical protein